MEALVRSSSFLAQSFANLIRTRNPQIGGTNFLLTAIPSESFSFNPETATRDYCPVDKVSSQVFRDRGF